MYILTGLLHQSVKSKSNFPRVSFSLSLGFAVSNSLSCLCNSPFLNDAGEFNGECNLCDSRRRCQRQAFGPNLDVKLAGATQDRYRLLISDSVLVQQAMLATQLNGLVKAGGLRKGSVVQLIEYICTHIQNRKIIVVLNMEIIIPDCDIIGNPKMFDESDSAVQKSVPERPLLSAASDNNNSHLGAQNAVHSNAPFRNNVNSSNLASSAQSFRPVVQPPYQPPPNFKGHGAIMKNEAPACIIPIAALNPYQGRWAIKARVTAKGNLHRYNNAKGDGKVFSFNLLDSDGGEIRATCFNAVGDRFYDVIEVGKVYIISKGSLKAAKKDFNHLKNEWQIFLESSSTVDLCPDEDAIPPQQFSFRPISDIESAENNSKQQIDDDPAGGQIERGSDILQLNAIFWNSLERKVRL